MLFYVVKTVCQWALLAIIPQGGKLEIINSLIQQGRQSQNPNLIGFAQENQNNPNHSILIENSILINDKNGSSDSFLSYKSNDSNFPIVLNGVDVIGSGIFLQAKKTTSTNIVKTSVNIFNSRNQAQLPAYSIDYKELPPPPGCPNFYYF